MPLSDEEIQSRSQIYAAGRLEGIALVLGVSIDEAKEWLDLPEELRKLDVTVEVHRIPQGDRTRKDAPMFRGLLGYFPGALFEVAAHSLESDRKHNPDSTDGPHWARGKSSDHEDCIVRHLIDKDSPDAGIRRYHLRSIAWRALAMLQEDCEAAGWAPGVRSVFPEE